MNIKKVKVTPALARELLETNIENNRSIRQSRVDGYADDIVNERWVEDSGETIKISTTGKLIDGQHRLSAIIKAGIPVWIQIAYGVPANAMPVIDTGASRRFTDTLHMSEVPRSSRVSYIVRYLCFWENGLPMGSGAGYVPTPAQLEQRFLKNPTEIVTAAKRAYDLVKICKSTVSGVAYYLFSEISQEDTDAFFDSLVSGANLNGKSPILILRNRLIASKTERLKQGEILCFFIRSWNNYRTDTPVTFLINSGTDKKPLTNYNFPNIHR